MPLALHIRELTSADARFLSGMYDQFDPLGGAQGLPPLTLDARRDWIESALRQEVNLGAFGPAGNLIGHCFLAADGPSSAEMAVFVHQDFRRHGAGVALVKAALEKGCTAGFRRIWTMTSSDNIAALRMLKSCAFRMANSVFPAVELEIELPPPCGQRRESRLLAQAPANLA
jgi:GNAT superfamily N-acetyltransferase